MTDMTPERRAHLRALAARVRTEEPSDALRDTVLIALGWTPATAEDNFFGLYDPEGGYWAYPPDPLTSIDAAAGAMPEGWILTIETPSGMGCTVEGAWDYGDDPDPEDYLTIYSEAPTEARARCAAALEAMAAEGDA